MVISKYSCHDTSIRACSPRQFSGWLPGASSALAGPGRAAAPCHGCPSGSGFAAKRAIESAPGVRLAVGGQLVIVLALLQHFVQLLRVVAKTLIERLDRLGLLLGDQLARGDSARAPATGARAQVDVAHVEVKAPSWAWNSQRSAGAQPHGTWPCDLVCRSGSARSPACTAPPGVAAGRPSIPPGAQQQLVAAASCR